MSKGKKDYPITIGGKVYLFRYNFDALTTIEDLTGKPFGDVLKESSLSMWKLVMFAGLKANHPDIQLDLIGGIIDEADNLGLLKLEVQGALLNSLGMEKPTEDGAKKKELSTTQTDG